MIGKTVTQPKPITLAQVEEILSKRSADGEFGYEQQKSFEYAKKFAKISARKAVELLGQLQEEFGVPYEAAVKIVDAMPKHAAQLRVLLGNAPVSEEKQKKIIEMLSKVKIKHAEEAAVAQEGSEAAAEGKVEAPSEEPKEEESEQKGKKEKKAKKDKE